MAHIANRSRFRITVKNKPDLTQHFSFDKVEAAEAYMETLRTQGFKPKAGLLPKPVQFASKEYWHPEDFQGFLDKTFRRTAVAPDPTEASTVSERMDGASAVHHPAKANAPRSNHPVARARERGAATLNRLNACE